MTRIHLTAKQIQAMVFKFIIFGLVGLGQEIVFTSLYDQVFGNDNDYNTGNAVVSKSYRQYYVGYSSLLYFPFYGITPWLIQLILSVLKRLQADQIQLARLGCYLIMYHFIEYICMRFLFVFHGGSTLSYQSYKMSTFSVHGFTRLDYVPFFLLSSLLYENLYYKFL